jgi:hypothetical protein
LACAAFDDMSGLWKSIHLGEYGFCHLGPIFVCRLVSHRRSRSRSRWHGEVTRAFAVPPGCCHPSHARLWSRDFSLAPGEDGLKGSIRLGRRLLAHTASVKHEDANPVRILPAPALRCRRAGRPGDPTLQPRAGVCFEAQLERRAHEAATTQTAVCCQWRQRCPCDAVSLPAGARTSSKRPGSCTGTGGGKKQNQKWRRKAVTVASRKGPDSSPSPRVVSDLRVAGQAA